MVRDSIYDPHMSWKRTFWGCKLSEARCNCWCKSSSMVVVGTKTNAQSCPFKTWFCGSHSCCLKQLPQTILSKAIVRGSPCDSMDHLDLKPVRMFGSMRCIRCWNSLSHWFSTEATALAISQTLAAVECFGWKPNEIQPLTVNRPDVGIAGCCPHFYDEPLAALRTFSCDAGSLSHSICIFVEFEGKGMTLISHNM